MTDRSFLDWPFFVPAHRDLALALDAWAAENLGGIDETDVDAACRELVRRLAADGWLDHCVPAAYGGASEKLDVRALCLIRETLARHSGLADFAFAMQGLGSGAISLYGSDEIRAAYLPMVRTGQKIAAFALSEPVAGSDVAALATTATRDGNGWRIDGEKTWISNGGIADYYTVFARTVGQQAEVMTQAVRTVNRLCVTCVDPDLDRIGGVRTVHVRHSGMLLAGNFRSDGEPVRIPRCRQFQRTPGLAEFTARPEDLAFFRELELLLSAPRQTVDSLHRQRESKTERSRND